MAEATKKLVKIGEANIVSPTRPVTYFAGQRYEVAEAEAKALVAAKVKVDGEERPAASYSQAKAAKAANANAPSPAAGPSSTASIGQAASANPQTSDRKEAK